MVGVINKAVVRKLTTAIAIGLGLNYSRYVLTMRCMSAASRSRS